MRKDVSNVGSVTVVVNRRDDAEFVSANVEYRVRGDVVRCAKSPFERVKVREFAPLHHAEPCRERILGLGINLPELA